MSIFSWIAKLFKKIFNAVMRFIKKFWWLIVIALIVMVVFFPAVLPALVSWVGTLPSALMGALSSASGWLVSLFQGLTLGESLALAAGLSFLLAPKETAEAIGGIIKDAGSAVGDAAGGVASGLFSSSGGMLIAGALAVGLFLWLSGDDEPEYAGNDYVPPARPASDDGYVDQWRNSYDSEAAS